MPKPCEIRSKSRWKTIFCPQLRNTRTAAGLKPKPYETQAEKCRTSPKERIKKLAGSIPKPCEIWSKSRWKTIFCPQLRNTRTAAGLMPKPYETQARCPNHAKYDRKADGKQSFVRSCETLEQQQDWCPNHTKHKPENCRTSPKERIKKLAGSIPKPCGIDAQTIRNTSQKSAERHEECIKKLEGSMPKPCEIWSKSRWKTIFCPQLRNTRTAAGLMPKPYETQARKLPNVT